MFQEIFLRFSSIGFRTHPFTGNDVGERHIENLPNAATAVTLFNRKQRSDIPGSRFGLCRLFHWLGFGVVSEFGARAKNRSIG